MKQFKKPDPMLQWNLGNAAFIPIQTIPPLFATLANQYLNVIHLRTYVKATPEPK